MANQPPTHIHVGQYGDPLLRPPSPASSIGTTYRADQTDQNETVSQLSDADFEKMVHEKIRLHLPRNEETQAGQDPLLTVPGPNGQPVRISEKKLEPGEEKVLHEHVMASLRAKVAQLQENRIFEQILLRGSKAALEIQPTTNDIDLLMQSMMGPGMNLSGPSMGSVPPQTGRSTATAGPGIANGPWNNFGQPSESERREHSFLSTDNMLSGTTVGKRSRNGTFRKA